ncbi:MAG: hypothetical protein QM752_07070 [Gammaproteobacteria bacterium]
MKKILLLLPTAVLLSLSTQILAANSGKVYFNDGRGYKDEQVTKTIELLYTPVGQSNKLSCYGANLPPHVGSWQTVFGEGSSSCLSPQNPVSSLKFRWSVGGGTWREVIEPISDNTHCTYTINLYNDFSKPSNIDAQIAKVSCN